MSTNSFQIKKKYLKDITFLRASILVNVHKDKNSKYLFSQLFQFGISTVLFIFIQLNKSPFTQLFMPDDSYNL